MERSVSDDTPGRRPGPVGRLLAGARGAVPFAVPLLVLTAAGWVGTAMAAVWLEPFPLLVIGLSPRLPFLAAASQSAPLWPFYVVAVARLCAADPFNYMIGRRYGPVAVNAVTSRVGFLAGPVRLFERFCDRFGLLAVLVRPTQPALLAAGARGLPRVQVAVAAVAGTVAQVAVVSWAARLGPVGSAGRAVQSVWEAVKGVASRNPELFIVAAALIVAAVAVTAGYIRQNRNSDLP